VTPCDYRVTTLGPPWPVGHDHVRKRRQSLLSVAMAKHRRV